MENSTKSQPDTTKKPELYSPQLISDQIQEATAELDTIRDDRDLSLCVLMALVYAEKRKSNPGKPA